jgi:hypothetical protein
VIVVRDIFQLKFGKAREALALMGDFLKAEALGGYPTPRVLTDLTGEYYTLVMESTFESLSAMEAAMAGTFGREEWRRQYEKLIPLVRSGRREVFRIVQ